MKYYKGFDKSVLLIIGSLLLAVSNLSAQIINEGFEEPIWSSFTTGTGLTANGSVTLPNSSAYSTYSYLTSGASYTAALNTCNNSGTWYYSRATTMSATRFGSGAHSLFHSIKLYGGGYIITPTTPSAVVKITFWAANATGTITAGLATGTNVNIPSYNTGISTAPGAFTYATSTYPVGNNTMQSFSFAGTSPGPCRFGIFNSGAGLLTIDDITIYQPTGTPPSIITNSANANITSAAVSGTVTAGTLPLLASGIIWSTFPLTGTLIDTFQPKTYDTLVTSTLFTDLAAPLIPSKTYYCEAYVIGLDGSFYAGTTLPFTTKAPTVPILSTLSASNILSTKAIVGGNITDSGGLAITQKGVCWSTTSGRETATSGTNFTIDGTGGNSYNTLIKSLLPSTTYYVKAYAKNSIGLAYGNEIVFSTSAAVPTLSASITNLTFPTVIVNSNPSILAFTLTGSNLSPTNDTIKITPPTGFSISTTSSGGFITAPSVLSIPYSNNTLRKTIYVRQVTSSYASYSSNLLLSGGGAQNPDIDTVMLVSNIIPDPTVLTNLGTDFWIGHGLEERMSNKTGYGLQLYIATGAQTATIKVSIPSIPSFVPQYYTIAPDSVQIVSGFPTGDATDPRNVKGLPDVRLYYTGISNRGIHVESVNNVPIAVFLNDYATNNSAGGSMVYPTNTWQSSYIVQTYGGAVSNTGVPNSYFFVMAKEDNTIVTFKTTAPIIDSVSSPIITLRAGGNIAYRANITNTIILNKGQVFNAVGLVDSSTKISYDLSGTTVTSDLAHPISVFAGNSRTLINAPILNCTPVSGSDNLIQQMFPAIAWGTKYLTVPTKTMEYNVLKIGVQDPNTIVTVDGNPLSTALLNTTGMYYEIEGNTSKKIESDKPICVTQFILSGGCSNAAIGNIGTGDPEMILLSPVQQSINSTTVYTSDFKVVSTGGAYINVVIPHSGVSSFKLDGKNLVDTGSSSYAIDSTCGCAYGSSKLIPIEQAFNSFPQDTSYYWAKLHVSYPSVHTLSSNVGFNSIAYGMANGESWGYNAGTSLKDLSTKIAVPTISIATSDTVINVGTSVTFTARVTNAGVSSGYQWLLNGKNISGATDSTFTTTNLFNNDTISCVLTNGTTSIISNQISIKVNVLITGNIKSPLGKIIQSVSVNINGTNTIINDSLGNYRTIVPQGLDYTIIPTKNNDKTIANGINGTDISLIQSHILKKVNLNSPYKLIAADVNNDGAVNGTDIALIKSLILKHIAQFNGNRLWSFVDSSYIFPLPTKPFPYYDGINITAINRNQAGKNFIGVKLGDVNYDWNATILGTNQSVVPIQLFNENISVNNKSPEIRVPIKVKNFKNIMGMQFTLNFNSQELELKSLERNHLGIDYTTDYASDGKIPFLWVDVASEARTITDSTILFELVFNKKGNLITESIDLTSDITSVNAFDGNYATVGISKLGGVISEGSVELNELKVYPNPAKNVITIQGSHINQVQVLDNFGKVVKLLSLQDAKNPVIKLGGLTSGVYHLKVLTINGTEKSVPFIKE